MTTKKYYRANKEKLNQKHQEWIDKNRDKHNVHRREYCEQNREEINRKHLDYVHKNPHKYKPIDPDYYRNYCRDNKERISRKGKERTLRLKTEVLTHYGNGKLACVKCGFDDIRALSIDHINNDGAKFRKTMQPNRSRAFSGLEFYTWLKKNNYPCGLQTLCFNCQWVKRLGG